jgi:hypothetical protein
MAELADALDSGSSGGNTVEVQVLLTAPILHIQYGTYRETAYPHTDRLFLFLQHIFPCISSITVRMPVIKCRFPLKFMVVAASGASSISETAQVCGEKWREKMGVVRSKVTSFLDRGSYNDTGRIVFTSQGDQAMKITVNGMTIEGTPHEVTMFLQMNNMLPAPNSTVKGSTLMEPAALNLLIYKQMGKRHYQTRGYYL